MKQEKLQISVLIDKELFDKAALIAQTKLDKSWGLTKTEIIIDALNEYIK